MDQWLALLLMIHPIADLNFPVDYAKMQTGLTVYRPVPFGMEHTIEAVLS